MKLIVKKNLNVRVGAPSTDAPKPYWLKPGDVIDVEDVVKGTMIDGNDTWYKNKTDGGYYWSGGVESAFSSPLPGLQVTLPPWIVDFGINQLWEETKGEGVTVFVLDTGFTNCPDVEIENSLTSITGSPTDKHGHGTLMASIIAGKGINIAGLAPNSKVVSIKISEGNNFSFEAFRSALSIVSTLAKGAKYCVVNCSFTMALEIGGKEYNDLQSEIDALSANNNIVFVAAVGNFPKDFELPPPVQPAGFSNVVSCAGLDKQGMLLSSSTYWNGMTITAPGIFPQIDFGTGESVPYKGSSHACAFISGLMALAMSQASKNNLRFGYSEAIDFLKKSSQLRIESTSHHYNVLDQKKILLTFKNIGHEN